jgi:hypothetical protein
MMAVDRSPGTPYSHRMATRRGDQQREQEAQQARQQLEALRGHSEMAWGSSLARAAKRATDHFLAREAVSEGGAGEPFQAAANPDPIEIWGRRIGRALSLAGVIGLAIYLALTYWR